MASNAGPSRTSVFAEVHKTVCVVCYEPINSKSAGFSCGHCTSPQCASCADAWWTAKCEGSLITAYTCVQCKKARAQIEVRAVIFISS